MRWKGNGLFYNRIAILHVVWFVAGTDELVVTSRLPKYRTNSHKLRHRIALKVLSWDINSPNLVLSRHGGQSPIAFLPCSLSSILIAVDTDTFAVNIASVVDVRRNVVSSGLGVVVVDDDSN